MKRAAFALLTLLVSRLALAAPPTVAVLPFKDLSGSRGAVGEAIRETVTSDLKEVPGLRVIERAALDAVLAEQNLQKQKSDLDPLSTVKIGKLLGASLIVAGAYQRAGARVRLTARFVDVETGAIAGTAKVDGADADLLTLQDHITVELLKSAGLARRYERKVRPRVKYHAFELYGDAVVENEPVKKQAALKRALGEDPDFVYALRDLDALDKRLEEYSKTATQQLAGSEKPALERVLAARGPEKIRAGVALLGELDRERRWHALADVATQLSRAALPPELAEAAAFALFDARLKLKQIDLALQDGEHYLKEFPTAPRYRDVEKRMHEAVETRRTRAGRKGEYDRDLAERRAGHVSPMDYDFAPCGVARWNSQQGPLMLETCLAYLARWGKDPSPDGIDHSQAARFFVLLSLSELGEFARAKPYAEGLLADSPKWREDVRTLLDTFPTD